MNKTITVDLASRSYDIMVGERIIAKAGEYFLSLLKKPNVIIITDENVAKLYLHRLCSALDDAKISQRSIILGAGEATKSLVSFAELMETLLEQKPDRDTMLIALGGGVIGDITGFAASVLLRGVDYIQIPTTLLAQVDSSVGGKTAINSKFGKNLIGSFYQPRMVLSDVSVLNTLPKRQLLAGYGETLKYALINDDDFFAWLESSSATMLNIDPTQPNSDETTQALIHAITKSCAAKAAIVAEDEKESGVRALLNFGHTFAHALEAETGFSDVLYHGEAVALGMILAIQTSVAMGICPSDDLNRIIAHYKTVGLPVRPYDIRKNWNVGALMEHFSRDKKVKNSKPTFILTRGIGKAFSCQGVENTIIREVLAQAC